MSPRRTTPTPDAEVRLDARAGYLYVACPACPDGRHRTSDGRVAYYPTQRDAARGLTGHNRTAHI